MNAKLLVLAGLLALTTLLSTGCFEVDDHWVLNPDGSGKVTRTLTLNPRGKEPKDWAKLGIKRAKGVAAWSDFSAENLEDGRLRIQATAYFKDLKTLDLKLGPQPYWIGSGETRQLELSDSDPTEARAQAPRDAQHEAALAAPRQKLLSVILRSYKGARNAVFRTQVQVSGAVSDPSGFALAGKTLSAELPVAKVYEALEPLKDDVAFLARRGDRRLLCPRVSQEAFGGMLTATIEPQGPCFDYAKEVAEALKGSDRLLDDLGVDAVAGKRKLRARTVSVANLAYVRGEKPFEHMYFQSEVEGPRAIFVLRVKLNGKPLQAQNPTLASVKTRGGQELANNEAFNADYEVELDDEDASIAVLEFHVAHPQPGFKGFARVAGSFQVMLATGTKQKELGIKRFLEGESTADVEVGSVQGSFITLNCAEIAPEDVQSVRVETAQGKKLEVSLLSKSEWGEGGCALTLDRDDTVAPDAEVKVWVTLYSGKTHVEIPFELKDLDVLGSKKK